MNSIRIYLTACRFRIINSLDQSSKEKFLNCFFNTRQGSLYDSENEELPTPVKRWGMMLESFDMIERDRKDDGKYNRLIKRVAINLKKSLIFKQNLNVK